MIDTQVIAYGAKKNQGISECGLVYGDVSSVIGMTDEEKIDVIAAQILKKFKPAFLELAK